MKNPFMLRSTHDHEIKSNERLIDVLQARIRFLEYQFNRLGLQAQWTRSEDGMQMWSFGEPDGRNFELEHKLLVSEIDEIKL